MAPPVSDYIFLDFHFHQERYDVLSAQRYVTLSSSSSETSYDSLSGAGFTTGLRAGYRKNLTQKFQAYAAAGIGSQQVEREGKTMVSFRSPNLNYDIIRDYESRITVKTVYTAAIGLNALITRNLHAQIEAGTRGYQYLSFGIGYEFGIK